MLFVVHDHETGEITQANKVYDPTPEYVARLNDSGVHYVTEQRTGLVDPDKCFVRNGGLYNRPRMRPSINRRSIKALSDDSVVIVGAPKGVRFSVSAGGVVIHQGDLPDGELELGADLMPPGLYRISLEKWPYCAVMFDIEATA